MAKQFTHRFSLTIFIFPYICTIIPGSLFGRSYSRGITYCHCRRQRERELQSNPSLKALNAVIPIEVFQPKSRVPNFQKIRWLWSYREYLKKKNSTIHRVKHGVLQCEVIFPDLSLSLLISPPHGGIQMA